MKRFELKIHPRLLPLLERIVLAPATFGFGVWTVSSPLTGTRRVSRLGWVSPATHSRVTPFSRVCMCSPPPPKPLGNSVSPRCRQPPRRAGCFGGGGEPTDARGKLPSVGNTEGKKKKNHKKNPSHAVCLEDLRSPPPPRSPPPRPRRPVPSLLRFAAFSLK